MSDNIIHGAFSRTRADRLATAEDQIAIPVETGGGPPHDPGMETRVAVLERIAVDTKEALVGIRADIRDARGDIQRLDTKINDVRENLGRLDGRVSQLPSTWQMITTMAGLLIAFSGLIIGVLKFTH